METEAIRRVSRDVEKIEREALKGKGGLPGKNMINRIQINRAGHPHHQLELLRKREFVGRLRIRIERASETLLDESRVEDMVMMLMR
jgi:hypothetical protein